MSDSTMTAPVGGATPQVSKISEAVIRFAGNSQDGIQAIGGFLARLAGRSEQEVMTFMTIPSTISGGPSIFQVRIGSGEVLSAGDDADVLVAFYQHSYDGHIAAVRPGAIVLYDSDHVQPIPELAEKYRHIGVPISSRTVEAIGGTAKDKGKNLFTLGLIARMFDLNVPKLERLITERFAGKDESIVKTAMSAFNAGYGYSLGKVFETFQFTEPKKKDGHQVVMTGNEALAYGLIAAGIRFGAAYPITPWSEVMEILRRELPKYGGTFVQCEDEIASVCMAIGAGWGGHVAVTGSSGPGVALKTEAIGWAVMAEVPLIICDIQRGGPSTGMPTSVEQSDLNMAVFGGHGDAHRVVLATESVEDCFYTALEAVKIARQYNVPVFILSDQSIATRIEAFEEPPLEKLCQDISPDLSPVNDYTPYPLSGEIQPRVVAGTQILSGKYPIATGLEHDEMGHPTGSPKLHMQMTARRRRKLQKLAAELPKPQIYGAPEGNVLLVGWGSTHGPIREAVERARAAGNSVSAIHLRHISPLPNGLEEIFAGFNEVVVVEMNDEGLYGFGQLGALLRARYALPKIRGLNKTDGLTWRVREILEGVKKDVATGLRKL